MLDFTTSQDGPGRTKTGPQRSKDRRKAFITSPGAAGDNLLSPQKSPIRSGTPTIETLPKLPKNRLKPLRKVLEEPEGRGQLPNLQNDAHKPMSQELPNPPKEFPKVDALPHRASLWKCNRSELHFTTLRREAQTECQIEFLTGRRHQAARLFTILAP